KKGERDVDSDWAKLMANSIAGSRDTQSFWLDGMHERSICVTVRLARSVAPSDSG
ncbi:hypothetical protein BDR06DRAFT_841326, partial [Suillus hirtellus]